MSGDNLGILDGMDERRSRLETPVVRIGGRSMEPTLPVHALVLVTDELDCVKNGEVVVLEGSTGPVVHRLIHRTSVGGDDLVYHRGDLGGGIGVAPATALRGRAVAILEPDRAPMPPLSGLAAGVRRSLRIARARCRLHAAIRATGFRLGLDRVSWLRSAGRFLQGLVLGVRLSR